MKIKVIKVGMPTYWYKNHIGETFDVDEKRESDGSYTLMQTQEEDEWGGFSFVADDIEVLNEAS